MGKMNRIVAPLRNGDKGRDCEVEGWCGEPAYQLSSSDRLVNSPMLNKGLARYERTIIYKCGHCHKFNKTFTIEKNLLQNSPEVKHE